MTINKLLKEIEDYKSGKKDGEYCDYCKYTDYGNLKSNTSQFNMCEGIFCEETKDIIIDSYEEEINCIKLERKKKILSYTTKGLIVCGIGYLIYKIRE